MLEIFSIGFRWGIFCNWMPDQTWPERLDNFSICFLCKQRLEVFFIIFVNIFFLFFFEIAQNFFASLSLFHFTFLITLNKTLKTREKTLKQSVKINFKKTPIFCNTFLHNRISIQEDQ